jgi:hypothetical protein
MSNATDFEDNDERNARKEAETEKKKKQKRGKAVEWELKFEFCKQDYAKSDLAKKLKLEFVQHRKSTTKLGVVTELWCKYGKKRGFSCPVKVKLVDKAEKIYFMDEKEAKNHNHEEIEKRKYENYTNEQVNVMKESLQLDMNTRNIKKSLKNQDLIADDKMPATSSFYHKINQLKKELKRDQVKITLDEFKEIVENNSAIPKNADEAYIVESHIEEASDTPKYSILISTPRLIEKNLAQQTKQWCLLADATYQTNMEDAPVILFGANTYDTGTKFVGIGVVISSNEDKPTYDFLLKFVKDRSKIPPAAIMADGSAAVTASCKDILPQSERLMCWYHASKKIQDRLKSVKKVDAGVAKQIYNDIHTLQHGAFDEESFFLLAALMKKKWLERKYTVRNLKTRITEFFLYLNKSWLKSDINKWYESANPMMLSTNNSLEAHNNVLKRDYTGRKKVSMGQLVDKLKEMVTNWSENPVEVRDRESDVSMSTRRKAEELLEKLDKFILFRPAKSIDRPMVKKEKGVVQGTLKYVGIFPREAYDVTTKEKFSQDGKALVKRRQTLDYDTFDDFKDDLRKVAVLEVIEMEKGELTIFCNCYTSKSVNGCKGDLCIHVCAKLIQQEIIPRIQKLSKSVAKKRMPMNKKQNY